MVGGLPVLTNPGYPTSPITIMAVQMKKETDLSHVTQPLSVTNLSIQSRAGMELEGSWNVGTMRGRFREVVETLS